MCQLGIQCMYHFFGAANRLQTAHRRPGRGTHVPQAFRVGSTGARNPTLGGCGGSEERPPTKSRRSRRWKHNIYYREVALRCRDARASPAQPHRAGGTRVHAWEEVRTEADAATHRSSYKTSRQEIMVLPSSPAPDLWHTCTVMP